MSRCINKDILLKRQEHVCNIHYTYIYFFTSIVLEMYILPTRFPFLFCPLLQKYTYLDKYTSNTFNIHIASMTSLIPRGGLFMVLMKVMSCGVRVSRAARAELRIGIASARSASHSSLIPCASAAYKSKNASWLDFLLMNYVKLLNTSHEVRSESYRPCYYHYLPTYHYPYVTWGEFF